MNVYCLCPLLALCDVFCKDEAFTGETCREECKAESKIEKSVWAVTNSVVKSSIEFIVTVEFDLPIPSIKANAIMMRIRYLIKFFTPTKGVYSLYFNDNVNSILLCMQR